MADTYGFGGSGPTRDVPNRNGDGVHGNDGATTASVFAPLDDMHDGNIRGMSPVSGLMPGDAECNSDWEATTVKPMDTVSVSSGGQATGIGTWPIQNYGNSPRQASASGAPVKAWDGSTPGAS